VCITPFRLDTLACVSPRLLEQTILSASSLTPPTRQHAPPAPDRSLDYPGIGPEHAFLKDVGRAEYYAVTDAEALDAFQRLSQLEGIIPALETSHAIAYLETLCPTLPDGTRVVLNCSGRGDKDVNTAIKAIPGMSNTPL